MGLELSNAKLLLLAINLASSGQIDSLASVLSQHCDIFTKELALQIIITYLPETISPSDYIVLLKEINTGQFTPSFRDVDSSVVESLSEEEAAIKARSLTLKSLIDFNPPVDVQNDLLALFLLQRAYQIDEQVGLLTSLPDLLVPFFDEFPSMRLWYVSEVLPFIRRRFEYYPLSSSSFTLSQFQALSETDCVDFLLSQTGLDLEDRSVIGRDFRGLIGPWLQGKRRWVWSDAKGHEESSAFPKVLNWLLTQSSKKWKVALEVITQWGGPVDVDLGSMAQASILDQGKLNQLQAQYLQVTLGCIYLVPESSAQAIHSIHDAVSITMSLLGFPKLSTVEDSASNLYTLGAFQDPSFITPKLSSYMRNDLVSDSNPLTSPSSTSLQLLQMLTVSGFLLAHHGIPYPLKTIGDLVFFQDSHGQQGIVTKYINSIAKRTTHNQEIDWIKAREELLWLRCWGDVTSNFPVGVLGAVDQQFIEKEFLKAILSSTRHLHLAKSIYEDNIPSPLDETTLREIVVAEALKAYNYATNLNRHRGGMKKCDEILHVFPKTLPKEVPEMLRLEALIKATHALSEYRLVITDRGPLTPAEIRQSSDPVSLLATVLAQNPKSYTKLQDFLDIASNMIKAGLCDAAFKKIKGPFSNVSIDQARNIIFTKTENWVIAMCIEAALREDDFETAYSYVVNRLASNFLSCKDDYAWRAALQAGKYIRSSKSTLPTHVGTGSINPDIRHLEQRIECLSTALRIAPATQLQELLYTFHQCEEQLDVILASEAANEDAWDVAGDSLVQPSAVPTPLSAVPPTRLDVCRTDSIRSVRSSRSARSTGDSVLSPCHSNNKEPEESMSLFDLSKATARLATRNLTALSNLTGTITPPLGSSVSSVNGMSPAVDGREDAQRTRKRDQLREAAMGTLVSGVGWLVGAPAPNQQHYRDEE